MNTQPIRHDDPIRAVLVETRTIGRRDIIEQLADAGDVTLVGEATSLRDLGPLLRSTQPEVAVIGGRAFRGDGALLRSLSAAHPAIRFVVFDLADDSNVVRSARDGGAHATISSRAPSSVVADAVRTVARGRYAPDRASRPAESPADALLDLLVPREREILELMAAGAPNRQISAELHLADSTLRNYITSIFRKLAVTNRADASALLDTDPA
ncbi:response regulator transcription factor [Herbiconiux liukaitaii]|uniref:response regulator transcription factor n=1 Tax=Herbiconiux liukaitaii TaxID=3342799 RepID=UPI0035B81BD8